MNGIIGIVSRRSTFFFIFQPEDGIRDGRVTGVQTCALPISKFALNRSRTWLLSGSHPPPVAAACLAAIDVLEHEPEHVERLWALTRRFKASMRDAGFDIGRSETPITPILVGESATAKRLSARLAELGVFALPIVFPMVAKGKARIRTIMNAALSDDDLGIAIDAFAKAGRELGLV